MPTYGTGIGVYTAKEVGDALEHAQVSSTYEGRHLTFLASDISHEHDLVTKGHPVIVGENIVGIAFKTEVNASDLIPIDTEGVWRLLVLATDEEGNNAVAAGDELFLSKSTWRLSKDRNKNTHVRFGYALGSVTTGQSAIIAVKVHWNPDDAMELVGLAADPYVSDLADRIFREYHYDAGGGGLIEGERMELSITSPAVTACVDYRKLILDGTVLGVTGRSSAIEAKIHIVGTGGQNRGMGVLVLDFENECVGGMENFVNAYIWLRERSGANERMRNLVHFHDIAAIPDAGVDNSVIFLDTATDHAMNCAIRCGYGTAGTEFWIMCTTTRPD